MAKTPTSEGLIVTAEQLAFLWDCDVRTVQALAKEGLASKAQRGQYRFDVSNRLYIKHLRERAAGRTDVSGGIDVVRENALLKQSRREIADTQLAVLQGRLINLDEVRDAWSTLARKLRASLLALPDLIASALPALEAGDVLRITGIVRELLASNALTKEGAPAPLPGSDPTLSEDSSETSSAA